VEEKPSEGILSLLAVPKSDLFQVEKTSFQVFSQLCELIFCIPDAQKCDFCGVGKAMIEMVNSPCGQMFCSPPTQN
jgi:hypothetical protein